MEAKRIRAATRRSCWSTSRRTFFFVVRRLQERFAKVAWFAENVVCEPFVATMKVLFSDSVHKVIDSGRFTAEQRKRVYFASPEFDLTKLTGAGWGLYCGKMVQARCKERAV